MAGSPLTFFYQLQHLDFATLEQRNFKFGVVDDDDAGLSRNDLSALNAQGKSLWAYVSAGEAETYRSYYKDGNWGTNPPDFIIDQNPNWATGLRVKFWDTDWQQIVINRIDGLVRDGYGGTYLDVVDVYNVPSVRAAFLAENPTGDIREAMEDFIVRISEYAKGLNPNFKIVVQNAVALMNEGDIGSLTEPLTPNIRFLNAIDGIGKESTFTLGTTYPLGWTEWDKRYVENATNAGKFVIGLEYPTSAAAENYALTQMLEAGYIPYFDNRNHDGNYLGINTQVPALVNPALVTLAAGNPLAGTALIGSAVGDSLVGNNNADIVYGYAGNDTIHGLGGNDIVSAGDGNDVVYGATGNDRLVGSGGDDKLFGDDGNDRVNGGAGNDSLYGWAGNDTLDGVTGNDFIMGEAGLDNISGGAGNDTIYAGLDNDTVYGDDRSSTSLSTGNDYMLLDDGDDVGHGGAGNDTIYAGAGNDRVIGANGNDFIGGDAGNDSIDGGAGNDTMFGWTGNDTIIGGTENDILSGEAGLDRLSGGKGNDSLYGGADRDTFVYERSGGGLDVIADFVRGQDVVQIVWTGSTFASVIAPNVSYATGNAVITLSAGNSLTLLNIGSGLSASDFLFV